MSTFEDDDNDGIPNALEFMETLMATALTIKTVTMTEIMYPTLN